MFWYEQPELALEIVQIVNDVLWLHYPFFYSSDGTPVEGLSYSYLSIADTVDIAATHLAAFGFSPQAIDVTAIESTINFHLAAMDTSAMIVDFGTRRPFCLGWFGVVACFPHKCAFTFPPALLFMLTRVLGVVYSSLLNVEADYRKWFQV